jgi:hypothetical protein
LAARIGKFVSKTKKPKVFTFGLNKNGFQFSSSDLMKKNCGRSTPYAGSCQLQNKKAAQKN